MKSPKRIAFGAYLDLRFRPFHKGGVSAPKTDLSKLKSYYRAVASYYGSARPYLVKLAILSRFKRPDWRKQYKRLLRRKRALNRRINALSPSKVILLGWIVPLVIFGLLVITGKVEAEAPPPDHNPFGVEEKHLAKVKAVAETARIEVEPMPLIPVIKPPCGTGTYVGGQCTFGVASWTCVPAQMGNANRWDDYARARGIAVDNIPVKGAIAQSDAGYYGHVALVLDVRPREVFVRGMNEAGPWSVRERWAPTSEFVYIHF